MRPLGRHAGSNVLLDSHCIYRRVLIRGLPFLLDYNQSPPSRVAAAHETGAPYAANRAADWLTAPHVVQLWQSAEG